MANMDFEVLFARAPRRSGSTTSPSSSRGPRCPDSRARALLALGRRSEHDRSPTSAARRTLHHLATFWARRDRANVVVLHYDDSRAISGRDAALAERLGIAVPEDRGRSSSKPRRSRACEPAPIDRAEHDASIWKDNREFFHRGKGGRWRDCSTKTVAQALRRARRGAGRKYRSLERPGCTENRGRRIERSARSPQARSLGRSSRRLDRGFTHSDPYYELLNKPSFLELVPEAGRLTIEVGCGEGLRRRPSLLALGHRVLGFDSSPTLARAATESPRRRARRCLRYCRAADYDRGRRRRRVLHGAHGHRGPRHGVEKSARVLAPGGSLSTSGSCTRS